MPRELLPAAREVAHLLCEAVHHGLDAEAVKPDAAPIGTIARDPALRVRLARARYFQEDPCPAS
ncbi:MAG: hypothetical protein AAGE65_03590 [Planctomycetota bacterium]